MLTLRGCFWALPGAAEAQTPPLGAVPPEFQPGAAVRLAGSQHLWVADSDGVLHWGGDVRGQEIRHIVAVNESALPPLTQSLLVPPWSPAPPD
jgi:hypothetical protein